MSFVKKWIKNSSLNLKKLKQRVDALREQGKEIEEPILIKDSIHPKEHIEVSFSLLNLAQATILIMTLGMMILYVGAQIGEVLLILFIAILFSAALSPTVDALEKRKIPRFVSVLLMFALGVALFGFFISQLIPLVAKQVLELARNLSFLLDYNPEESTLNVPKFLQPYMAELSGHLEKTVIIDQIQNSLKSFATELQSFANDALGVLVKVFNGFFNLIVVMVLTFFLVVDQKGMDHFFTSLFPSRHTLYILERMDQIRDKVGHWLRGQILMMFLMFVLSGIFYFVLGLDYALTLAMLAGVGEVIPFVGGLVAGLAAILVAINHSYLSTLLTIIAIIVIQQIEGNILYPAVMRRAVGLSPVIIIVSMLIGFKVLGVVGGILAVPVSTCISIFVRDYTLKKSQA